MTEPCNMELGHGFGLDAYGERTTGNPVWPASATTAPNAHAPEPVAPARPHRPEPLDPKLADMAHRLRHDAGDLRERACRLPFGARRHRLFRAALDADSAALEIEALPEAAEVDAANAAAAAASPPRSHRHG